MNTGHLKALAEAATAGPWYAGENYLIGGWWVTLSEVDPARTDIADFVRKQDAKYIAALSPNVVLRLITERDAGLALYEAIMNGEGRVYLPTVDAALRAMKEVLDA